MRGGKMHELFANILAKRDLSKAGELFSIEDQEIVEDIEEVVSELISYFQRNEIYNFLILAARNFHNHFPIELFG
jgi:hypothetical protein